MLEADKRYSRELQRWSIQVTGDAREDAMAEYLAILEAHGIHLPVNARTGASAVGEPQVLDFGDFEPKYGLFEVWIAQEDGAGYGGKFLVQREGEVCPAHHHLQKTETFYVLAGTVEMHLGELGFKEGETEFIVKKELRLGPGDTLTIAPGVAHLFKALNGPAIIQEFATQCFPKDNVFADRRIGFEGVI